MFDNPYNKSTQIHTTKLSHIGIVTGAIFITLAWIIPNHYYPWAAFYNDLSAALGLLMLASSIFFQKNFRGHRELTWPAVILLALTAIPVLQLSTGQIHFAGDAWTASLYLAGLTLAYLTGFHLNQKIPAYFTAGIAWTFLFGAIISVMLALYQWLQLGGLGIWLADMPPGGRPYANLGQPNNLATLFVLGVLATIYLREKSHLTGLVTSLTVIFLFIGITMTQSRTPWVIMLIIASWILRNQRPLNLKTTSLQLCIGILILTSLSIYWESIDQILNLNADTSSTPRILETSSGMIRLVFWEQFLDAIVREPWLGFGWNQASFAQVAVAADHPQSSMTEYSHNLVLDMLIWNGVIIGGLFILGFFWWLLSRLRYCQNLDAWFGLAVILVVSTHGLLEYPYAYAYFLLPLGICAGLVDHLYPTTRIKIHITAYACATLIGWISIVFVFSDYRAIENDHRLMRYQAARIGPQPLTHERPNILILNQLSEFIRFARTEAHENMEQEKLDWMQNIAHRYPYPPALFRYALALGLNHRYKEAGHTLLQLKQLHPPIHIMGARNSWAILARNYPQLSQVEIP